MNYKAIFLRKIGDKNYMKIGDKKFNAEDSTVRYKERTFVIPKEADTYSTKKCSYIFFDFDNSEILNFIKNSMVIDSRMLDKLISQNIIGKLVSTLRTSMQEPDKWKLGAYIIVFIFGVITGVMLCTQGVI